MKSWSLLVFAGLLSVGKANVELYSFFKETDSKHSVQKSDVHSPSVAASLLQVPVGFQLHLVPSSLKSSLGSPNTISLPQQSFIPSLRVSDVEAAPNKTATTRTDETTKQPSSDVTTSEAPATADLAVRSVVRVGPDLLVAQVVPSNDTEIQHTGHVLLPATRSQILLQVAKSPQPPNNFQDPLNVQQSHNLHQSHNLQQSFSLQQPHNLQQPHKLQHLQTTSQLRCDFPEYRAMVCVGDLETTCDRPYRVDPKCPFKQERCLCSEGYVRPFDYHQVHHMSGTCNPESSCQKKECNQFERKARICINQFEPTCSRGPVRDTHCRTKRETCICNQGYVRGDDYRKDMHVTGRCYDIIACLAPGFLKRR